MRTSQSIFTSAAALAVLVACGGAKPKSGLGDVVLLEDLRRRRRRFAGAVRRAFGTTARCCGGEERAKDELITHVISPFLAQSSFAGGSMAMTGAVKCDSPRSSDAVGYSSGLI